LFCQFFDVLQPDIMKFVQFVWLKNFLKKGQPTVLGFVCDEPATVGGWNN
jgi:hypothetical protein